LTVIAAAIIGGTSINGGLGTIPGAVLGSLLLSVLATGLILLNIDPTLQQLATGIVLVLAAGLDQFRRRKMFRTSARHARAAENPQPAIGMSESPVRRSRP
jgi:ABC-type xylose transport system permease subunit